MIYTKLSCLFLESIHNTSKTFQHKCGKFGKKCNCVENFQIIFKELYIYCIFMITFTEDSLLMIPIMMGIISKFKMLMLKQIMLLAHTHNTEMSICLRNISLC